MHIWSIDLMHKMYQKIIVVALLFFIADTILADKDATVQTAQGKVIGTYVPDGDYFTFYGVPYAGPTTGSNRFKAPTAAPNFTEDFRATDSSVICAQPSENGIVGVEDCLVLNIFTKNLTDSQPVIVFIDGEDYTNMPNSKQFSFEKFVEHNVIVITINYRLSVFGFLCLGVKEAPGNAGLKDIIAGLQWVKQNIKPFGGNEGNIILFGHGSGGAMVDLVTLSPMSVNLVHKAIASSGASLAPWAVAYDPIGYASVLATKLGIAAKNSSDLAKALQTTDINDFGTALNNIMFLNNTPLFAPCIEKRAITPSFLHDAPINIIRSGSYTDVPFIAGYADKDGTLRIKQALSDNWFDQMEANFSASVPVDIINSTEVAGQIKKFYFSTKTINLESVADYVDYQGDTMFVYPVIRTVLERSKTSSKPVRIYEISYQGSKNSDWTFTDLKVKGAVHGSILKFIFDYDLDVFDVYPQIALIGRWVNFACNGIPINSSTSQVKWEQLVPSKLNYLHIRGDKNSPVHTFGESSAMNPRQRRKAFWDAIYDKQYVPPKTVAAADQALALTSAVVISQIIVRYL